ncbi:MAG: hypothetical protein IPI61_04215 [Syntrophaceae bacterium]|nr:hypothetical protein [Syntrophaceae bacterium]
MKLMDVEVINMENNPVAKHALQFCHTALSGASTRLLPSSPNHEEPSRS